MEIKTKYNIGDTVFFIKDGVIKSGTIEKVHVMEDTIEVFKLVNNEIYARKTLTVIKYYIGVDYYEEYTLASSKKELIKQLEDETEK